jgi:hypothetical protein
MGAFDSASRKKTRLASVEDSGIVREFEAR